MNQGNTWLDAASTEQYSDFKHQLNKGCGAKLDEAPCYPEVT